VPFVVSAALSAFYAPFKGASHAHGSMNPPLTLRERQRAFNRLPLDQQMREIDRGSSICESSDLPRQRCKKNLAIKKKSRKLALPAHVHLL